MADVLQDLDKIQCPDTEGGPAADDGSQHKGDVCVDRVERQERHRAEPELDEDEQAEKQKPKDERHDDRWRPPTINRGLRPRKVEEHQRHNADEGARQVQNLHPRLPVARRRILPRKGRDHEVAHDGEEGEPDGHDPERPGPPGQGQQRGKGAAKHCTNGRHRAEEGEHHGLAVTRGVGGAKDGERVGQADGRADALEHAGEDGEAVVGVDAEAGDERPQREPGQAGDEEALIPEDVAQAAGEEDEGADGQGVAGNEPGELRRAGDVEGLADCAEEDERAQV